MNRRNTRLTEEDAAREVERLAKAILEDPPSSARSNILGPIGEWISTRPGPRRTWEQKVLDATKQKPQT